MERFTVALDPKGRELKSPAGRKYLVSDRGTIKLENGQPRKLYWKRPNPNITINERNYDVKNIMYRSFIGEIKPDEKVVFSDGDRFNTDLSNLKKITRREFSDHHLQGKLREPIRVKCRETGSIFASIRTASQIMNINSGSISASVKNGWCVKGYHFERA